MPCIYACVTMTGDRKRHPGRKIGVMTVSMHVRSKEQNVYESMTDSRGQQYTYTSSENRNLAHLPPAPKRLCMYFSGNI